MPEFNPIDDIIVKNYYNIDCDDQDNASTMNIDYIVSSENIPGRRFRRGVDIYKDIDIYKISYDFPLFIPFTCARISIGVTGVGLFLGLFRDKAALELYTRLFLRGEICVGLCGAPFVACAGIEERIRCSLLNIRVDV